MALPLSRRFARPYLMFMFCIGIGIVFVGIFAVLLFQFRIALPILVPLFSLFSSGAVMGSLYWQDEVQRSRDMVSEDKAKEDMTAMLVHDLRNAVAPILMSLDAFESERLDDDVRELYLPIMKESSEMLLCQINSLLDIRRMKQGQMLGTKKSVDLWSLCDGAVRRFGPAAEQYGRKMVFTEASSELRPSVAGDEEILERVLMNLLWNAIKYAAVKSTIEVGFALSVEDAKVEIYVRNRCNVIPEERQIALFELLQTGSSSEGLKQFRSMGLGLPFCRLAAEAHEGSATLHSPARSYDDGVEIVIQLPCLPS